jgi:hypothetical protein
VGEGAVAIQRATRQVFTYRRHRVTLVASGERGWSAEISRLGRPRSARPEVLRNNVPAGGAILLDEVRRRIDRWLDGAAWQSAP